MPQTEEITWRHVWLKSVLIDSGKPFPTKIQRHRVTRRMSLARRQEKLHRSDPRTAAIVDGKVAGPRYSGTALEAMCQ
jgi:hypothetical protein